MFGDPRLPGRFWSKVAADRATSCWTWSAALTNSGYPKFRLNGRHRLAHRVAFEALVAPIGEGLQIDHLCRNRRCVNPAHLEPVTPSVNTRRGTSTAADNAIKTHCKRGHEFTSENTLIRTNKRVCIVCKRLHSRATYRRSRSGKVSS